MHGMLLFWPIIKGNYLSSRVQKIGHHRIKSTKMVENPYCVLDEKSWVNFENDGPNMIAKT